MKKIIVSSIIIIAFVLYGFIHSKANSNQLPLNTTPINTQSSTSQSSEDDSTPANPSATATPLPTQAEVAQTTPTATPTPSEAAGQYKNGTYTGIAANAFYGNIQVQVTINGRKLSNVAFLQYPNNEDHSIRINRIADPMLAQEAIQAQSAQVDIISGATDTSEAFIQSLTSALNQAR